MEGVSANGISEAPTKWDKDMIDLLEPVVRLELRHKALFYANTFPLAYHYAWALRAKGLNDDGDLLRFSMWGRSVKGNEFGYVGDDRKGRQPVPVTVFQPKYVFAQKTMATSQIADRLRTPQEVDKQMPVSLSDFLVNCGKEFESAEIYAELEELGEYLETEVRRVLPARVYHLSDGRHLPLLSPFGPRGHSVLKLFIYGGPLSTYLKRKRNHYVATEVRKETEAPDHMLTGVLLPETVADGVSSALQTYHRKLYDDATALVDGGFVLANGQCPPFYSVYRAYNEMAWLLQHRSSFEGPYEYATCLMEHHGKVAD